MLIKSIWTNHSHTGQNTFFPSYHCINIVLKHVRNNGVAVEKPSLPICNDVDNWCGDSGGTVPVREGRRRLRGRQFEIDLRQ